MAIIDTSSSTSAPSGADIDGDGLIGDSPLPSLGRLLSLPSTDPGDSVLAAEVAAVRALLDQLDPTATRVGVISFAGDSHRETPDAKVAMPLTDDYAKVEAALHELLRAGPRGRTNIQDAVLLLATELTGGKGALSRPRPGARRIGLLMTDGHATLPDTTSRPRCARLAVMAAGVAAEHGIRIDTFAVGHGAADQPWVTVEMADATSGVFTPVVSPGELIAAFQEVRLTDISGIQINNLTTGRPAEQVRLESDGGFGAFVELAPGRNRIEVRAFASDGRRILRVVDARLARGAAPQELSPRAMTRRTRMLETRLDHTRSYTLQLEAEKREKMRMELEKQMREKRKIQTRNVEINGEDPAARPPEN
jgi:hypothetical protein